MRTKDPDKEKAIRKKAIELIARKGLDGLTMQKLARAANVSPATIYLYFKDRDDLVLQVYLEASIRMNDASLKNFDAGMHFAEGLRVQWFNRAEFCMNHPMESALLDQLRHSPLHSRAVQLLSEKFAEVMKAFVMKAMKNKELISFGSFEVFWAIVYAPLYQLVRFHQQGRSVFNQKFTISEDLIDEALKLVIKAVTP